MQAATFDILITILLLFIHSFLVPYLAVAHVVPDILLIWVVYLAIRRGQLTATVAGFLIGLVMDLTSEGREMVGLTALTKSVGGFLGGYFFNENRMFQILGGSQFIIAVAVVSLAHHLLYFLIFLQGKNVGFGGMVFQYAVPATLYNVLLALLPMFIIGRKHGS
jgi:rod shape-determining protein MreD